jgi:hypothetical protein
MITPMPAIQEPTIYQREPQQMQLDQKGMGQHLSEQIGQMLAPPIQI